MFVFVVEVKVCTYNSLKKLEKNKKKLIFIVKLYI
jgi:hypothetical protein